MREIATLKELAKGSEDIIPYGQKAEGLVELIRKNNGAYVVDTGFAISVDYNRGDSPELKSYFDRLASIIKSPMILMARSSDPEEVPGKFESHTLMHTPGNETESYKDFVEAVEKVRASGARAVVCQIGAMEQDRVDVDWDYKTLNKITEEAFGSRDTGFVYNTQSRFGKGSVICAVRGLASKIVRGDSDICMIQNSGMGVHAVNINHNYHASSLGKMEQGSLDVIKLSNPKQIVSQDRLEEIHCGSILGRSSIPFFAERFRGEIQMEGLFEMFDDLKTDGRELEIEGSCLGVFGYIPHLFQLRHYEVPQGRLLQLTRVSDEKLLLGPFDSYVSDKIEGDLNFVNQADIKLIGEGQIVFCNDYNSLMYGRGTRSTERFVEELRNKGAAGVVIPIKKIDGLYTGDHETGVMTQELFLLQKYLTAIAMDAGHMAELERRVVGQIIPDIVVESDSDKGQVYHK